LLDRERIDLPSRTADPVAVVLDNEKDRKLPLLCEGNRFVKIALPRSRFPDGRDDNVRFAIELDAPGQTATRK
jgi:hypothetical protein